MSLCDTKDVQAPGTTSNRRGVLCPGLPAVPTEWNTLKHFLRKSGESNQASSTTQLCASSVFLALLVHKITNSDCLSFKTCMCKSMLCLYHSTHLVVDVVLYLRLQNSFYSKPSVLPCFWVSERFYFLGWNFPSLYSANGFWEKVWWKPIWPFCETGKQNKTSLKNYLGLY